MKTIYNASVIAYGKYENAETLSLTIVDARFPKWKTRFPVWTVFFLQNLMYIEQADFVKKY